MPPHPFAPGRNLLAAAICMTTLTPALANPQTDTQPLRCLS